MSMEFYEFFIDMNKAFFSNNRIIFSLSQFAQLFFFFFLSDWYIGCFLHRPFKLLQSRAGFFSYARLIRLGFSLSRSNLQEVLSIWGNTSLSFVIHDSPVGSTCYAGRAMFKVCGKLSLLKAFAGVKIFGGWATGLTNSKIDDYRLRKYSYGW